MIDEWRFGKNLEGRGRDLLEIWLEEVRKTAKNLRTAGATTEIRTDHHRNTIFLIRIVGVHSARQPLIGLLHLSRLIMRMENLVE
jgi:hypothetical protein